MYRLIVESLLGLGREGDRLRFTPCLPQDWAGATIRYRYGATIYEITLGQASTKGEVRVSLDGVEQPDNSVPLVDDRAGHRVIVH
jgi:cellobiose phosphorylase